MALFNCHFYSEVLGLKTSMTVILPQDTPSLVGMKSVKLAEHDPTLYLLHGGSDDDTIWLRRTSIERYVAPLGLAVVMPQVQLSFYTDMEYGLRYYTFVSEELPKIARQFFSLSDKREDNYVAGLSMGGYGTLKIAFNNPDKFAAAASLSGAVDAARLHREGRKEGNPIFKAAFGERDIENTENDLYWLMDRCAKKEGPKPKLFQSCGTEDFLYADNVKFRDACRSKGFDLTYQEESGGHEWGYWDKKIQDVLAWLPLRYHGGK